MSSQLLNLVELSNLMTKKEGKEVDLNRNMVVVFEVES